MKTRFKLLAATQLAFAIAGPASSGTYTFTFADAGYQRHVEEPRQQRFADQRHHLKNR